MVGLRSSHNQDSGKLNFEISGNEHVIFANYVVFLYLEIVKICFFSIRILHVRDSWPQIFSIFKILLLTTNLQKFWKQKIAINIFLIFCRKVNMTSKTQHSSIWKNIQKSFKPGFFDAKNYLIMNTKNYLKLGVVMLLFSSTHLWSKNRSRSHNS